MTEFVRTRRMNADPFRFSKRMAFGIAVATSAGLLDAATPAAADTYPIGQNWRPDNSEHTYCWGGEFTPSIARQAANYAAANLDSQTTMYDTFMSACSGNTDVVWGRDYDEDNDGSTFCMEFTGNGTCDQFVSMINFDNMAPDEDWKQTACHELGHTVGLDHASNDCMGTNYSLYQYSDHHVDHINNDRWP